MTDTYRQFLEAKVRLAPTSGFDVDEAEIHPYLKPHARAITAWAIRGGRRGIFASFGLHKTVIQLETVRITRQRAGGRGLIVVPLGVRQEFFRDAKTLGVPLAFIRSIEEAADPEGIYLTNYETIREGKLDLSTFTVASLDEADVLRSFGSKTFSEFLYGGTFTKIPHRFVATATPDPNDFVELLGYAQFLDVMDIGHAKTRFFKRDSEHADRLTLYPHTAHEFWLWVASWAIVVQRPSDLGFSDEGYDLPPLDVRWHEIPSNHATAGVERDGQARMYKDSAHGVTEASREKRESLPGRIAKLLELRAEDPSAHRIIWHHLEIERHAIARAIPTAVSVYGTQKLEERDDAVIRFSDGVFQELSAKPSVAGAGCNFQRHCAWSIFLGIDYKFRDLIQAIHRTYRFLQPRQVRIDIIYTEAERAIREDLEAKWARYTEQCARLSELIREYGLAKISMASALQRSIGVERVEVRGEGYHLVNADAVDETRRMPSDSIDLIFTSIPFSTQYEYTPSYNDFGHTDSAEHFWRQMDFLSPELLRVAKPGRNLVVHIKDRVRPGVMSGFGFQDVDPFHCDGVFHFRRHGFAYLGMITIVTDVVRENAQTYRLGWTEKCKDGSRMGAGLPEYLLLFRKPPSDASNGYADAPVRASKAEYSRPRWQVDAAGFWRSSGERLLIPEDLVGMPYPVIYRTFRDHSRANVYDYEHHVACGDALDRARKLPPDFTLLPLQSWHPHVWADVMRARTLNAEQALRGREKHICPLQLDVVKRVILERSMEGDVVYDPFGGIMTIPYVAVKLRRRAIACELNASYFRDGAGHTERAVREVSMPTLLDLLDAADSEDQAS